MVGSILTGSLFSVKTRGSIQHWHIWYLFPMSTSKIYCLSFHVEFTVKQKSLNSIWIPTKINTRSLLSWCRPQQKSLMNSSWFEECGEVLDGKFLKENQFLIIDDSLTHLTTDNLSNVVLIFLPINTMFLKYLKSHYRKYLVRMMVQRLAQVQDLL